MLHVPWKSFMFITIIVTRLTRRVSLVEQELLTLPEHLSSLLVFSGVRVTRSLVLYVCFVDRCLSFCTFYFGHCVVCSSSIYGFWLPFWYFQTLLILKNWTFIITAASCSHLNPCYPGICQGHSNISETTTVSSVYDDDVNGTNSSQCMCLSGFDGPTCLLSKLLQTETLFYCWK